VHRLLASEGISARPSRREDEDGEPVGTIVERRSYIAEHVGDLWVGDALHVHRRVRFPDGFVGKAYLLSQIDSASRYLPHSYFSRHEEDVDQEHGFAQAIRKFGPPRSYYVDHGPAYVAGSLAAICAELSIRLRHAGKKDPEAKGVIERWHRTWREEVEDELPRDTIALEDLTAIHFAWLAREYHERTHDTTGMPPRERFLAEVNELRAAPPPDALAKIFLHRETRTVRKDATVRWRASCGKYARISPSRRCNCASIRATSTPGRWCTAVTSSSATRCRSIGSPTCTARDVGSRASPRPMPCQPGSIHSRSSSKNTRERRDSHTSHSMTATTTTTTTRRTES
jgi:hypothetical protein